MLIRKGHKLCDSYNNSLEFTKATDNKHNNSDRHKKIAGHKCIMVIWLAQCRATYSRDIWYHNIW